MKPAPYTSLLLGCLLLCSGAVAAGLLDGQRQDEFLQVDQAFKVTASAAGDRITVSFDVAPEHYLYRHAFAFELPEESAARLGPPQLPQGEKETDDFFGEVETYRGFLDVTLKITEGFIPPSLSVRYQGCADAGLCYPPQVRELVLGPGGSGVAGPGQADAGFQSAQDRLAGQLADGDLLLIILSFLGLGLLLAFTPCVLPMIPILSGIVVGAGASAWRGFALSCAYVLAMALAYTVFGVLAGLFGGNLQAALQSPWVLVPFSILFFILAAAMFGLFQLSMPESLQAQLAQLGQGRGGILGAGALGFTSALIVGPCLAPPLAGALLYIGSSGDAVTGGVALFAMGLGMGLPLIVLGSFGGGLLPRAGAWMEQIKILFGVILIGVGIWLLGRLLPAPIYLALWALLFAGYALHLWRQAGARMWLRGLALVSLTYAVILVAGASAGAISPFAPLPSSLFAGDSSQQRRDTPFTRVAGLDELQTALSQAARNNKPVVLDFYADWCVECVHMENGLFRQAAVHEAMTGVTGLQVDVTEYGKADREVLSRYGVIGPPTMIFFDRQGEERKAFRLIGAVDADGFIQHLKKAIES